MNIAIITVAFPTVSETFITSKVLHLASRGHNVMVFCDKINAELFKDIFGEKKNVKVTGFTTKKILSYLALHPFALSPSEKNSFKKRVSNKAKLYYINKSKPDIVHVEFSSLGINYLPVLKKIEAKKIVSCRGSAEKVKLLVSDERKQSTKLLFDEVDAIHCVSDDMKNTILPYCAAPNKIFINYPSIDVNFFERKTPRPANNIVQILSVGRFTFQKGYIIGLLAVKKLKEIFPAFKWVIVGDGPQLEEIKFAINQMKLNNEVTLLGAKNRAQVFDLYSSADIFFLPSVYEGIANVALEAMSMQLPVVATKSGGMDEVITHDVNGLLADVYDCDNLASQLLELVNNKEKREMLATNARRHVIETFTIEQQADIFETIYKKLINN